MRFSAVLPFLISLLVSLLGLELFSRYWIQTQMDPLQRARRVMQSDPLLGWRQKSFLNSTFEGASLYTDQNGLRLDVTHADFTNQAAVRTLVLGPSSAFGWGVDAQFTYSHLLNDSNGRSVNAGQIGHGIEQGRIMWEILKSLHPKFVIVAFGVNDIDRFRFYGADGTSDEVFFSQHSTERLPWWEKLNFNSGFWSLVTRGINEARLLWPCPPSQTVSRRLDPEKWIEKLLELNSILRKDGVIPIFLTSAFHYPIQEDSEKASRNEELYRLSAELAQNGQCGESRQSFLEARQLEPYRVLQEIKELNRQMNSLSKTIQVVSIEDELNSKEDFVDPIHPSVQGHNKIARLLQERMLKLENGK